jgi:A/G-specific adenine glycosylase
LVADALIAKKSRTIGRERIEESIYRVTPSPQLVERVEEDDGLKWASRKDLQRLTLSGPHRRWIEELSARIK